MQNTFAFDVFLVNNFAGLRMYQRSKGAPFLEPVGDINDIVPALRAEAATCVFHGLGASPDSSGCLTCSRIAETTQTVSRCNIYKLDHVRIQEHVVGARVFLDARFG